MVDKQEAQRRAARAQRFSTTTTRQTKEIGLISRGAHNELNTIDKQVEFFKHIQQELHNNVPDDLSFEYCISGILNDEYKCEFINRRPRTKNLGGLMNNIRALREALIAAAASPIHAQVLEFAVRVGIILQDATCYTSALATLMGTMTTISQSMVSIYILDTLYSSRALKLLNPMGLNMENVQICLDVIVKQKLINSWLFYLIKWSIEGDYHQFYHWFYNNSIKDLGIERFINYRVLPIWHTYTLHTIAKSYKCFPVNDLKLLGIPWGEFPLDDDGNKVLFKRK